MPKQLTITQNSKVTKQKGQSLFEVVVAIGIITLILVALISLTSLSLKNTGLSRDRDQANRTVQETIEWLRSQRDESWNDFYNNAQIPTWCMVTLDWSDPSSCGKSKTLPDTVFKREVRFDILNANTIEAKAVIYWTDSNGFHEVRTSTLFTNW